MLYTASFYHQEHWEGKPYRVSRAHPRGQTTRWEVQPFLYPSRQLLTEYRDGALDFDGLSERYREELQTNHDWEEDFTLLCFEPEGEPCHRRVAAAWLLEIRPELALGHMR